MTPDTAKLVAALEAALHTLQSAPPSPHVDHAKAILTSAREPVAEGLDAMTVEACARIADSYGSLTEDGRYAREFIAEAIRSLTSNGNAR